MLSTCPSCLTQVLHEDGVAQLNCECGETFSPFLIPVAEAHTGLQAPIMAMGENKYLESEAAFAELRDFGETLGDVLSSPAVSAPEAQRAASDEQATPQVQMPNSPSASLNTFPTPGPLTSQCMITAGDSLAGFGIDTFLPPISVWTPTSLEADDPLAPAYNSLSQKADQLGANGVVSVRWSFTPDGSRILMNGTPVKCRKLE